MGIAGITVHPIHETPHFVCLKEPVGSSNFTFCSCVCVWQGRRIFCHVWDSQSAAFEVFPLNFFFTLCFFRRWCENQTSSRQFHLYLTNSELQNARFFIIMHWKRLKNCFQNHTIFKGGFRLPFLHAWSKSLFWPCRQEAPCTHFFVARFSSTHELLWPSIRFAV